MSQHCLFPYWTVKLPSGNRAWPVATPKLSLSAVSVKAVWPGPKLWHCALFQWGGCTENSVQSLGSCLRSWTGVILMALTSWIPMTQSLSALVPPLHLPPKGQWIAFTQPCRWEAVTCRAWEGTRHTEVPEETSPAWPAGHLSSEGISTGAKPHLNREFGTSIPLPGPLENHEDMPSFTD